MAHPSLLVRMDAAFLSPPVNPQLRVVQEREAFATRAAEERAAVRIQSLWRGHVSRKRYSPAFKERLVETLLSEDRLRVVVQRGETDALA